MKLKKNVKLLLIVAGILVLAVILSYYGGKAVRCNEVVISFTDSENGKYLEPAVISEIITERYGEPVGMPLSEIRIGNIEATIDSLPQVNEVRVYKTRKGVIHIEIDEREPLCRVFGQNSSGVYIDTKGVFMPVSKRTPARVPVINGYFSLPDSVIEKEILPDSIPKLKELLTLTQYITKDEFLSAQIQQIYLDSAGQTILIPRVGSHDILLGKTEDFEEKMYRLKYFYFNVMGNVGWNNYKRLDLRFRNQIVAVRN